MISSVSMSTVSESMRMSRNLASSVFMSLTMAEMPHRRTLRTLVTSSTSQWVVVSALVVIEPGEAGYPHPGKVVGDAVFVDKGQERGEAVYTCWLC